VIGASVEGFDLVETPGRVWLVRPGLKAALAGSPAAALLEGPPPTAGAPGTGRGGATSLQLQGHPAFAKRALHGGLRRFLFADLFWGDGRGRRTVGAAGRLQSAHVRTPSILAAGWRQVLGPFCVHVLVTEAIPGAVNLHAMLAGLPRSPQRRAILGAAGRAVARMHAVGFVHADLNLANLVLESADPEAGVLVVDLDGGVFHSRIRFAQRRANLRRLLRSYEKWLAPAQALGAADAMAFLRGYCGDDRLLLRRLWSGLASDRRRFVVRRTLWRLQGVRGGGRE
jgi:tRNA A-37 threonylcarbamoyl transferase component Bud32